MREILHFPPKTGQQRSFSVTETQLSARASRRILSSSKKQVEGWERAKEEELREQLGMAKYGPPHITPHSFKLYHDQLPQELRLITHVPRDEAFSK
jgi:hypothetical protein